MENLLNEGTDVQGIVDKVIEETSNKFCKEICSPSYYKNKFLEHIIKTNRSLQCIAREYAKFLYESSNYLEYQNNRYHSNTLLTFLQNYTDKKKRKFINNLIHDFLDDIEDKNEYLIIFCKGREKDLKGVEAKIRNKLLMIKTLQYIINNFQSIENFQKFSDMERKKATKYLENLLEKAKKKNPLKDFHGFRLIVDEYGKNCTEDDRIKYCYQLRKDIIDFFENRGFDVIEQKDYIANPKSKSNYQSLHITVLILGTTVEIQIRTSEMHYNAEYGKASHDEFYKDTLLQNFLKKFLYNLSKKSYRISNENNGLLDCLSLIDRTISNVGNSEIPQTPEDFQPFEKLDLLEKILSK